MRRILSKLCVVAATVAIALFASCQQESDETTGNINGLGYELYATKYAEMWNMLWKGLNQNYVGWENETIDWDDVNVVTLPKLEALDAKFDSLYNQGRLDSITGKAIAADAALLFHSAIDSLHDGHLQVAYKDRFTKKYEWMYPTEVHLMQRKDYGELKKVFSLKKDYYIGNGQIVKDTYRAFSPHEAAYKELKEIRGKMYGDLDSLKEDVEATRNCVHYIDSFLNNKIDCWDFDDEIFSSGKYENVIKNYNLFPVKFENTEIQMFITSDNIAYFYLSSFCWPSETDLVKYRSDLCRSYGDTINNYIKEWHDKVYKMHNEGTLKGVVLDARGNNGGLNENLKYFAGLLFEGTLYQLGTKKMKNGIGRLDYTVPVPLYMKCYGKNSEDITEPIVILTNPATVSCGELSTAAVKQHENGISIGTTTAGMGATLINNPIYYSTLGYAGVIGSDDQLNNKTCNVYAYMPYMVTNYGGGIGSIEGKGIAPDIEIPYDEDLNQSTGRDNQFERALTYIREGK